MGVHVRQRRVPFFVIHSKEEHATTLLSVAHACSSQIRSVVDARGEPSPSKDTNRVEWLRHEHVACTHHTFSSSTRIPSEVRHVGTGRRAVPHNPRHDVQMHLGRVPVPLVSPLVPNDGAWGGDSRRSVLYTASCARRQVAGA